MGNNFSCTSCQQTKNDYDKFDLITKKDVGPQKGHIPSIYYVPIYSNNLAIVSLNKKFIHYESVVDLQGENPHESSE